MLNGSEKREVRYNLLKLYIIEKRNKQVRLRHKPWAEEYIDQHQDVIIPNPEDYKGKWNEVFGNDNPVHIEVGTGKGQFVFGMAIAKSGY